MHVALSYYIGTGVLYQKGSVNTIEGCNDCGTNPGPYTMMKDDNCDNEGDGWCIAGSIIVKAGCTLYGWEVSNTS